LWDEDASEWAPQNHSCNANTIYRGLNVVATKNINLNEELTLDYGLFLNHTAQEFNCSCGSQNCRGVIVGDVNNSIENNL